jgi:hypothetical protein
VDSRRQRAGHATGGPRHLRDALVPGPNPPTAAAAGPRPPQRLLATVALSGAAAPAAKRLGDVLGQPTWEFGVPDGLLLDSNGDPVSRASLTPSAVVATGAAVALATWDATHHSSFTVNNLVRRRPRRRPRRRALGHLGASEDCGDLWAPLFVRPPPTQPPRALSPPITTRRPRRACPHHTPPTRPQVACLVATELLQLLGVRSFRAAALLLTGLLCYDVFWVFASPAVVGDNGARGAAAAVAGLLAAGSTRPASPLAPLRRLPPPPAAQSCSPWRRATR